MQVGKWNDNIETDSKSSEQKITKKDNYKSAVRKHKYVEI